MNFNTDLLPYDILTLEKSLNEGMRRNNLGKQP